MGGGGGRIFKKGNIALPLAFLIHGLAHRSLRLIISSAYQSLQMFLFVSNGRKNNRKFTTRRQNV